VTIDREKVARLKAFKKLMPEFQKIESLLDKKTRKEIAVEIGVSEATLKRAATIAGWEFTFKKAAPFIKYPKELTKEVIGYYEQHGLKKTKEKFPEVKVRSIIERYPRNKARQSRWTGKQMVEAVKMAGLISLENQAKYFNRPRANRGAMVSLWQKRFGSKPGRIHGLPNYKASLFVTDDCPRVKTGLKNGVRLCLWVDCVKYAREDCPDFIMDAFKCMAEFQIKLMGKNPRKEIDEIIKDRVLIN